jgi:NCAIR mutase (PurE)-related protein
LLLANLVGLLPACSEDDRASITAARLARTCDKRIVAKSNKEAEQGGKKVKMMCSNEQATVTKLRFNATYSVAIGKTIPL